MLKVSGEQLGSRAHKFDIKNANKVCDVIEALIEADYEVACVMGGGNIVRGQSLHKNGIDQVRADQMGMMATVQNGIFLDQILNGRGIVESRLLSNLHVDGVENFSERRADAILKTGRRALLIGGGIGKPGLTTDTAVAIEAFELKCEKIIKTTKVDGIYTADPHKDPTATRYERLTYAEALANPDIEVMDQAAMAFASDKDLTLAVCKPLPKFVLSLLLDKTTHGTIVTN